MEWLVWCLVGVAGAFALTAVVRAIERCAELN